MMAAVPFNYASARVAVQIVVEKSRIQMYWYRRSHPFLQVKFTVTSIIHQQGSRSWKGNLSTQIYNNKKEIITTMRRKGEL